MIFRQIASLALVFCTFNGYTQQAYPVDQIAPALKNRANAVVRNMEMVVDMRAEDNVAVTIKKVITVLNKNGDDQAETVLPYSKNIVIKYAKGIIYDAAGKATAKFTLNNFSDRSAVSSISLFEDDREKHHAPNVLSYPYTISCEYEIRSKQNLVIPSWYANPDPGVSVEQNSYTFTCKPTDKIRIKAVNYAGQVQVIANEKFKSQTWSVKNLPAFKAEPYAPNMRDYLTHVDIAAEEFYFYGHKGTYQNWEELGKWIYVDLIKDRQTLRPETIEEIKNLVKEIDNDKDKARKIYEYVQKKTRYISVQIGIGGHQPMQANEVHQLSYGDCKALVNYTQSLLKAVGIPSWYCIVNAGNFKKNIEPDFASMNQGNHIILCLPFKSDTTWLECTSQENPFGYLGDFTDDRTVLACTEEGGKILKTPALTTQMNLQERKAELVLDAVGNVNGSMKTVFYGAQYDNCAQLVNQPLKEQLKLLKQTYDVDNINFSSFNLNQDKGANPSTKETLDLSIQKYAPQTNNHIYLVLNAFNKQRNIPEVRNRTLPVFINRGFTDVDEITYVLPNDLVIELMPAAVEIKNNFGAYTVSIRKEDKKLIYQRKFMLNTGSYPADKYADFLDFINTVSANDQMKAVFKTTLAKN